MTDAGDGIVLIVDDDSTNIEILTALLEREYEIVFAMTGEEALELLPLVKPDVILLDVMLPGLDGYEVCARVKRDARTADIPIVFISGLDDPEHEARALAVGATDHLPKPFKPALVRSSVRNHIELKRTREKLVELSTVDELTGLANRRRFNEVLESECKRLRRAAAEVALILAGYDDPERTTDGLIADLADVLAVCVHRPPDLAARFDEGSIAVILPDTDLPGAATVARRLRLRVDALRLSQRSGVTGTIGLSIGIASVSCMSVEPAEELVAAALSCLAQARASGGNRTNAAELADSFVPAR